MSSIVQYGGIGALEGSQECIADFETELQVRRDLFYKGIATARAGIFAATPPEGAFYAFLKIDPDVADRRAPACAGESLSWAMAEYLISRGASAACRASTSAPTAKATSVSASRRDRRELTGALESMSAIGIGLAR